MAGNSQHENDLCCICQEIPSELWRCCWCLAGACEACIVRWKMTVQKATCPLCRKVLRYSNCSEYPGDIRRLAPQQQGHCLAVEEDMENDFPQSACVLFERETARLEMYNSMLAQICCSDSTLQQLIRDAKLSLESVQAEIEVLSAHCMVAHHNILWQLQCDLSEYFHSLHCTIESIVEALHRSGTIHPD